MSLLLQIQNDRIGTLEEAQYILKRLISQMKEGRTDNTSEYEEQLTETFSGDAATTNIEADNELGGQLENLNNILNEDLQFTYEDGTFMCGANVEGEGTGLQIHYCMGKSGFVIDNPTRVRDHERKGLSASEVFEFTLEYLLNNNN